MRSLLFLVSLMVNPGSLGLLAAPIAPQHGRGSPPIPSHVYDHYFSKTGNGNCSTTWYWRNSIISSKVGFHGLFWHLQNWCYGRGDRDAAPPVDNAEGGEDKGVEGRKQIMTTTTSPGDNGELVAELQLPEAERLIDFTGALAGDLVLHEDDHATTENAYSRSDAAPADSRSPWGQYVGLYEEALSTLNDDRSLFCNRMPSCEQGSCLRERGEDYREYGRDVGGMKNAAQREGTSDSNATATASSSSPAARGRDAQEELYLGPAARAENVLQLCTHDGNEGATFFPAAHLSDRRWPRSPQESFTSPRRRRRRMARDRRSRSYRGNGPLRRADGLPEDDKNPFYFYHTRTPMDVVEKLGVFANLKTHGGYNGYSLEYMLSPPDTVLNNIYTRRFPDRVWETRGYETFLVHGSDKPPKGVIRFGIPHLFANRELEGRKGGGSTWSVMNTSENLRWSEVTAHEVSDFMSVLMREGVIRIPERDASNTWFRRGNPQNDSPESPGGGMDFPFVSDLSGVLQNQDSVAFYHRQSWREAFAEKVKSEQKRRAAAARRQAETEEQTAQAAPTTSTLFPADPDTITTSAADLDVAAVADTKPRQQMRSDFDDPTAEADGAKDPRLSWDNSRIFVVNPVKVFSNTVVVMASEWQNISHFTRMVIWLFELFTSDWFLTWIKRENLQPFVLPTKFLQDFHSLLPHNKLLLDVLFKHLTSKDLGGTSPYYPGVEFCMYLDEPYFMDYRGALDAKFVKQTIRGRHCIDWEYDPLPVVRGSSPISSEEQEQAPAFDASLMNVPMYDTDKQHQFLVEGYDYEEPKEPAFVDVDADHENKALQTTHHQEREQMMDNFAVKPEGAEIPHTASTSAALSTGGHEDDEAAFLAAGELESETLDQALGGGGRGSNVGGGSTDSRFASNQQNKITSSNKKLKFLAAAVTTIQEIGYPSFVVQRAHDGISSPEALARFRRLVWEECGIEGRGNPNHEDVAPSAPSRGEQVLEERKKSTLQVLFMEKDGRNRQIKNLDEIIAKWRARLSVGPRSGVQHVHFRRVKMTNFTPCEQIQLLYDSFIVISMHGADLTNTIFMRPNASYVVEISLGEGAAVPVSNGAGADERWRCDTVKGMMYQEMEPWVFKTNQGSISLSWDRTQNSYAYKEVLRRRKEAGMEEIDCKVIGNDTVGTYLLSEQSEDFWYKDKHQKSTVKPRANVSPSRRAMGYYSDFLRKAGITYDNLQIGVEDLPLDNPYDDFGDERFRGVHLTEEYYKRLALGRDRNLTVPFAALEQLVRPKLEHGIRHFLGR